MLATGERAARRLHLIDRIFGPATREFLLACGLRPGWRVAEIGCGVGLVSFWMAEQGASVVAVDGNQAQIEVAAKYARGQGIANLEFHAADAYNTGLPRASFDMVYSRFLMCHLPAPVRALREMRELLKPGLRSGMRGLRPAERRVRASITGIQKIERDQRRDG